jgi:hypothetical protein
MRGHGTNISPRHFCHDATPPFVVNLSTHLLACAAFYVMPPQYALAMPDATRPHDTTLFTALA